MLMCLYFDLHNNKRIYYKWLSINLQDYKISFVYYNHNKNIKINNFSKNGTI
jgi:hypothetical protein